MAHTHNAVAVASAVDSIGRDVELAHRAATLRVRLKPSLDPEKVVHELLSQQRVEKLAREFRGLNHWEEHAPKFLARVVRQARQDRLRRYQEAEAFYKAKHREIVRFSRVITGDSAAAEIVASDTYRELLEGSITLAGFFAALVANGRNYLARRSYRQGKCVPLDEAFTPTFGSTDMEGGEGEAPSFEPISHRLEDQDPLELLIAREEETTRRRLVAAAKEDPRWRYIKRRDWAAQLSGNVRN
ncbi:MAG: hypothetical protein A2V88_12195 [Elusimicrobia bacterium RBG_16_66_12]|nr:MAG: hypothetical protein A2V88_12195 [Elusimicrobia bacterium RBG_16_66_12]